MKRDIPLAEALRPQTLEKFFGQEQLRARIDALQKADRLPSMLFFRAAWLRQIHSCHVAGGKIRQKIPAAFRSRSRACPIEAFPGRSRGACS